MFRKRRATKVAIGALQPLMAAQQLLGRELPEGFWGDPYVLGYLSGMIALFSKLATNGKATDQEVAEVTENALTHYAGSSIYEAKSNIARFIEQEDGSYIEGFLAAQKTVCVTYGVSDFENDPDVEEARRFLKSNAFASTLPLTSADSAMEYLNSHSEAAELGGVLIQLLFHNKIDQRLKKQPPSQ